MWAAQFLKFEQPNRWMTSGGLGTMGYGFPAAMGVQIAHPDSLVIDVAGGGPIIVDIQEVSPAAPDRLPGENFLLNNQYMGMVRQWQELLHGGRYSESYMESLPDFVKLADAFGAVGLRCHEPAKLDDTIRQMIEVKKPVIVDVLVDKAENCFPMIPSGAAHYDMLLGPDDRAEKPVWENGMGLVGTRRKRAPATPSPFWSTTSLASSPAWSACSRAAATTSKASRSPRPIPRRTCRASPSSPPARR